MKNILGAIQYTGRAWQPGLRSTKSQTPGFSLTRQKKRKMRGAKRAGFWLRTDLRSHFLYPFMWFTATTSSIARNVAKRYRFSFLKGSFTSILTAAFATTSSTTTTTTTTTTRKLSMTIKGVNDDNNNNNNNNTMSTSCCSLLMELHPIGLGTMDIKPSETAKVVRSAIELGYRRVR